MQRVNNFGRTKLSDAAETMEEVEQQGVDGTTAEGTGALEI